MSSTAISPSGGVSTHEVGESSSGGRTAMSTSDDRHIRVEEQNRVVNEIGEVNQLEQGNLINAQQPPQPEQVPIVIPEGIINLEKHRGIRAERRSEEDAAAFRVERRGDLAALFRDRATEEAAAQTDRVYLQEEWQRVFRRTASNPEQNDPAVGLDGQPVVPGTTLQIDIQTTEAAGAGAGDPEPAPAPVSILILNPDSWLYQLWTYFIIVLAVFSSFFTPLEIAFFTDLPDVLLFIIDSAVGAAFFLDLGLRFFISYRDDEGHMVVHNRTIALRCLKSVFTYVNLLGCFPWDVIYVVCGREDGVRFLLLFRLYRAFRVMKFFQNIGINYRFIRFLKTFAILLYYVHIGGCIFYYLATILPESNELDTWIGSLALGVDHFREIDFGRRYLISLYFAVITLSTIGYGDIHAVSDIEMIFTVIYVLPSMVVVPYLVNYATVDL